MAFLIAACFSSTAIVASLFRAAREEPAVRAAPHTATPSTNLQPED